MAYLYRNNFEYIIPTTVTPSVRDERNNNGFDDFEPAMAYRFYCRETEVLDESDEKKNPSKTVKIHPVLDPELSIIVCLFYSEIFSR